MRSLFAPTLRLGVSSSAVSLLSVPRWGRGSATPLAEQPLTGPESLDRALRLLVEGRDVAGRALTVVLADELCRMWQVQPPPRAARLADIEAAASLRFHALYGESPAAWAVSADWHATEPFFAAAVPRALLSLIALVAEEHGMHVVEVVPHFVTAWNRWCRPLRAGTWFGQLHDNLLTLAAIDDGRLRAVRALTVPHGAEHYWLTQMVQREALLLGLNVPERVALCGALPPGLGKPAGEGQVAVTWLDAGHGDALSTASRLALAGRAA